MKEVGSKYYVSWLYVDLETPFLTQQLFSSLDTSI